MIDQPEMQAGDDPFAVTVREPGGYVMFRGRLIAEASSRKQYPDGRWEPRWTLLQLYQRFHVQNLHSGSLPETEQVNGYVLTNTGKSVLYHLHEGPCNLGVPKRVRDLSDQEYQELEPHTMRLSPPKRPAASGQPRGVGWPPCNPPDLDDLGEDDIINAEMDRPNLKRCRSATILVQRLRESGWKPREGTSSPSNADDTEEFLSAPAERLLEIAAQEDPAIWDEINKVRQI